MVSLQRTIDGLTIGRNNTYVVSPQETKISWYQDNDIETLSEWLEFLQITNEVSERTIEYTDDISIAPVSTQGNKKHAGVPKNIVPDLEWFNRDRTKFKDWWRGIRLFLKSNRVMETNDRIIAILAHLRGGVASIYAQKKLNELDKETETQD